MSSDKKAHCKCDGANRQSLSKPQQFYSPKISLRELTSRSKSGELQRADNWKSLRTLALNISCWHLGLDRRRRKSGSVKMIRQVLKQIAIANKKCPSKEIVRALSSEAGKVKFEVKINQQNETFELHDAEVEAASGKQKKYEFPFVYLRDNCQVSRSSFSRVIIMKFNEKRLISITQAL